jgi:acetyl esterase/lipase
MLQASQPERLRRREARPVAAFLSGPPARGRLAARLLETAPVGAVVQSHIEQMSADYLPAGRERRSGTRLLADPLVLLERAAQPARELPPCFAAVGTKDPLLSDTRRLARAYARLGATCEARYYPDQLHGFNVLWWTEAAQQCSRDSLAFLDRHVGR